jgi:hypothetical protein
MTAIIKLIPVGLIAALGICSLALSACRPMFDCQKEVFRHIPSPSGEYEALFVKSMCGGDEDLIWITLNERGGQGIGHLVAVADKAPLARWTAARTLRLTPDGTPLFPKSLNWRGIRVDLVNGGKYGTPGETIVEWNGNYDDPGETMANDGDSSPN